MVLRTGIKGEMDPVFGNIVVILVIEGMSDTGGDKEQLTLASRIFLSVHLDHTVTAEYIIQFVVSTYLIDPPPGCITCTLGSVIQVNIDIRKIVLKHLHTSWTILG